MWLKQLKENNNSKHRLFIYCTKNIFKIKSHFQEINKINCYFINVSNFEYKKSLLISKNKTSKFNFKIKNKMSFKIVSFVLMLKLVMIPFCESLICYNCTNCSDEEIQNSKITCPGPCFV